MKHYRHIYSLESGRKKILQLSSVLLSLGLMAAWLAPLLPQKNNSVDAAVGDVNPYGFVVPVPASPAANYPNGLPRMANVGVPIGTVLTDITPSSGDELIINASFISNNSGAPWLDNSGAYPVISGIQVIGACVNIQVKIELNNSYVDCPTRNQTDSPHEWDRENDAPALFVGANADETTLRFNTITCSGYDDEICARSINSYGSDLLVERNDLSFSRGGIQMYTGMIINENYIHDYSFGRDSGQVNNNPNVTHNNGMNNSGYAATVTGNFIVPTYGRVTTDPNAKNDYNQGYYNGDGTVGVGQTLNGYSLANYNQFSDGTNNNGNNFNVVRNYFAGGGPLSCQASGTGQICLDQHDYNFYDFDTALGTQVYNIEGNNFQDGTINGQCNYSIVSTNDPSPTIIVESRFYGSPNGAQGTSNCDADADGVQDSSDNCNLTPRGDSVDSSGCSTTPSNSLPTNLSLSSTSIQENNSSNAVVGALSTTDADSGDTHTYSLIAGTGDTDNASFNINGNNLRITAVADYETKSTYSIRLQTNDGNGGTYQRSFTITVTDDPSDNSPTNAAPTNITLSNNTLGASLTSTGAAVGSLTTTDADSGDTHTYSLIAGTGDTDNASFQVSGNTLQTAGSLNANTYSIRLQTNDGTATYQKVFTVTITNDSAPDTTPPVITRLGAASVTITQGTSYTDAGATASDNIDGNVTANIVSNASASNPDVNTPATYTITYNVQDAAGNSATQVTRTVTVTEPSPTTDSDGIDNTTEDNAPNGGDYNNDGTADSQQANVAALPNTKTSSAAPAATTANPSRYIGLASPAGTTITNLAISTEAELTTQDDSRDFPLGIFSFSLQVPTGSTQTVTITLDQEYPTTVTDTWSWTKYNSTTNTYAQLPDTANLTYGTTAIGAESVTTVTYELTDGGDLDEDNVANGTIVDPVGPSVLADTDTDTSTDTDTVADSGSGELADTGTNVLVLSSAGLTLVALVLFVGKSVRTKRYLL